MKIKFLIFAALIFAAGSICFAQSKTPTFVQYGVKSENLKNVNVDLKSHKNAGTYRTNLRTAAKEGVNFAGHFILTTWGCGTNCTQGAVIDARTGKVFFPRQLEGAGLGFCELPDETEQFVYTASSRLASEEIMDINGYRKEYLDTLHDNFPFVDYVSKYTELTFKKDEWSGLCPLCEFSPITLKVSSWHCKNCLMTPDGADPIFYSPEAFLSKFHRLDIFDAVCFMEGWVTTHTDAEIPSDRYYFIET